MLTVNVAIISLTEPLLFLPSCCCVWLMSWVAGCMSGHCMKSDEESENLRYLHKARLADGGYGGCDIV